MNKIVVWSLIASLAGFLFGFDTVVISGADKKLQELWNSSDAFHGTVVMGMALWGTVFGAIFGGIPTRKFGRRTTLIWIGIFYTISAIGSAFANDPFTFAAFRFIGGVGVGVSGIAAPAYISEIAPAKDRGKLVGLYQFNLVTGILIAFLSNYLLSGIGENDWRYMMGVEALPALLYTILVLSIPKSPRWLYLNNQQDEAEKIIRDAYSENEAEVKAKVFINEQAHFNFKISSAPLIKVSILKVSKNKHILLLTLHHIITDQWSMEILKEELAFNYKKLSSGLQPEITANSINFIDYAYWQNNKQTYDTQNKYWKNKLAGEIPVLSLPTDFNRPTSPSYKGKNIDLEFSKTSSAQILDLAKKLGVELKLIPFNRPGELADAVKEDIWDIGNIANEAERARSIEFSLPYTLIESTYLVRENLNIKKKIFVPRKFNFKSFSLANGV